MNDAKYIGMDVHQATISVTVRDSRGNLVIEAILETKADKILEFIHGLRAGTTYRDLASTANFFQEIQETISALRTPISQQ
jgi:hypothetical protein